MINIPARPVRSVAGFLGERFRDMNKSEREIMQWLRNALADGDIAHARDLRDELTRLYDRRHPKESNS